jgi:UDP-N-acetylglucosamine transferase subunit ALG13
VIFVTVGTHARGFDRLLGALGPLAEMDELVVQHGNGPPPVDAAVAVRFMRARDVVSYAERARAVVTHAGVGSFLVAWRAGHVPVVVPRLRSLGEHVDDHQGELVRALEGHGQVIAVWDVANLAAAVRAAPQRRASRAGGPADLHASVRRALDGGQATARRRWMRV